ncbi:MAG: hypothetical protein J0M35_12810 [Candidatus Obscuribacter phosphatis]|uniref:Uncharacterized protein n=1 Tax=Candidatus Obscuribacter phosphatis TaxID=1906157 RepID=A0A8J7TLN6_9BACT|nr:hypothetical protein [Candidatus Obscuribacter phosphatis]
MPSEESEAQRLKQKFGAGTAQTRVFDEWDEGGRQSLLSKIHLEDGEHPILGHWKESSNWLLTTTRRVIWTNPDKQSYELRNENIKKVGPSSGPEGWPWQDPSSPRDTLVFVNGNPDIKGHCGLYSPWLHFIDYSGTRYEAFLETGKILTRVRNSIWQLSGGWQRSLEDVQKPDIKSGGPTGSDAYRAGRLEFTFEKYPEKRKKTHLFSAFDSDVQRFLKSRVHLNVEEQPVLAFYEDASTWYLATSRGIVWLSSSGVHYIRYQEIDKMGWSDGPEGPRECEHKKVITGNGESFCKICRANSPWFFVASSNGQRHEIAIEAGSASHIWDSFRLMCNLERIHPRTFE